MAMPLIRFKRDDGSDYPDWENIELSKVFTEIKEKNRTDLPVLSVKQGYGTVLRDESGINMVYSKDNLKNYKAMKKDDFIIHLRSFEGGLECSNYDGISSPAYKILRCNDFVLPNVFKHYFRSQRFISNKLSKAIIGIRDGKNIDMNVFWKISIPIPCPEEQQKIADFLSDVDNQIENYQQSLDNLESQKKELLRQVFSQELRFKRDDGSDYPDWKEDTLKGLGTFIRGLSYSANMETDDTSKTLVLRANNIISDGFVDLKNNVKYVDKTPKNEQILLKGDIAIATTSSPGIVGKTALYNSTYKGKITVGAFCCIYRSCNPIMPYVLRSPRYKYLSNITMADSVGGFRNLYVSNLETMTFSVPTSLEEQQKIADFFSDFDNRIELERQRLQTMQEIKKGLLQQMFC